MSDLTPPPGIRTGRPAPPGRPIRTITANGLDFAYLSAGPADGPLALCLHGFPDSAHTWRHLLPELAAAGYHAVAPFMRGYAPTAVPADGAYQSGALAADVNALHEALGGGNDAVLIGHDWGAVAAYPAAAHEPDRWRSIVTLAVPPITASLDTLLTYQQIKRAFYIFLFQTPLAELALTPAFIEGLWRDWSPGYTATEDITHVLECLKEPANITAAIGYYRAMLDPSHHRPAYARQQAAADQPWRRPILYLHGADDGALHPDHARHARLPQGSRLHIIEGAGHFPHLERLHQVNTHILNWITHPVHHDA